MKFVGRKKELRGLQSLLKKKSASLVVIRGRRRIGKSRLADEFAKEFSKAYHFTGLPPEKGVTASTQRKEFANQMRQQQIPRVGVDEWSDYFWDLAKHCSKGRVLIILDEITWMGGKDPAFLGKLKTAWDRHFSKNSELIMILSGSNSAWIQKNILSSTGFVGRISRRIHLKELTLPECDQFWGSQAPKVSSYEKFKLLGVTGGIPRYLEEINPKIPAEENIRSLCYDPDGFLFHEFEQIFSTLFVHNTPLYKDIVQVLVDGPATLIQIAKKLGVKKGGDLSEYLSHLDQSGFISRDYTWNIKDGKYSKKGLFRLSDNYVRFYLKFISPYHQQISQGDFHDLPASWYSVLGLQFENLVLNNRRQLYDLLGIPPTEVVIANPYLQTEAKNRKKCQIDFMIQTKYNTLYVCEAKFEKRELNSRVLLEMKEKINRLVIPKGFSIRPVLIHVNGVSDAIIESDFFAHIIDFGDLFQT